MHPSTHTRSSVRGEQALGCHISVSLLLILRESSVCRRDGPNSRVEARAGPPLHPSSRLLRPAPPPVVVLLQVFLRRERIVEQRILVADVEATLYAAVPHLPMIGSIHGLCRFFLLSQLKNTTPQMLDILVGQISRAQVPASIQQNIFLAQTP